MSGLINNIVLDFHVKKNVFVQESNEKIQLKRMTYTFYTVIPKIFDCNN